MITPIFTEEQFKILVHIINEAPVPRKMSDQVLAPMEHALTEFQQAGAKSGDLSDAKLPPPNPNGAGAKVKKTTSK